MVDGEGVPNAGVNVRVVSKASQDDHVGVRIRFLRPFLHLDVKQHVSGLHTHNPDSSYLVVEL